MCGMNNQGGKKSIARIIKEGIVALSSAKLLAQLVNIAAAFLVIRALSVFEYGVWQLAQSAIAIIGALTLPTLENIFLTDMARDLGEGKVGRYRAELRAFIRIVFPLSFFVAVVVFFAAPFISTLIGADARAILMILSASFVLMSIKRIYLLLFSTQAKFASEAGFTFLSRFFYLCLIIILVVFNKFGIIGVALAYLFSAFLPLIVFFPAVLKNIIDLSKIPRGSYSFLETIKAHGKWSLLNDQTGIIGDLEPWVIKYFLGIEAVALFSVASSLYSALGDLIPIEKILRVVFPREITDPDRLSFLFQRTIKYFTWLYALMGIVAYVFAPPFLKLVFPKYLPSLFLFNIMLLRFLVIPISNAVTAALYTFRAQKNLFFINLSKLGYPLTLAIGIIIFGIAGTAINGVFFVFALTAARYYILRRIAPSLSFNFRTLFQFDEKDRALLKREFFRG